MNDGTYRDSSGRTLSDYPRPSVAVDTAVLTLDPELGLGGSGGTPADRNWLGPPGHVSVTRARRSLTPSTGRCGTRPTCAGCIRRQLHVFDDPHRDDRGWVLSVAHVEVVQAERLESRFVDATRLVPVRAPGRLPYDHADIIKLAVEDVRTHYLDKPDPDGLLGDEFTLRELRIAHEAIAGQPLQRDTFRRAMEPHLVATGTSSVSGRGRPAELFRRSK